MLRTHPYRLPVPVRGRGPLRRVARQNRRQHPSVTMYAGLAPVRDFRAWPAAGRAGTGNARAHSQGYRRRRILCLARLERRPASGTIALRCPNERQACPARESPTWRIRWRGHRASSRCRPREPASRDRAVESGADAELELRRITVSTPTSRERAKVVTTGVQSARIDPCAIRRLTQQPIACGIAIGPGPNCMLRSWVRFGA